jgi:hypothetical protein
MAPFVEYCRIRLADDPHLWASALLDELRELGYAGSYPSLTAAIRAHGLRPHCEPCQASAGRDAAIIAHPPGEETQFDWLELPGPPLGWGCGSHAHLLVGALSASGRWRGVLAECEDFAHLAEALDQVACKLGGLTRRWRFDRMGTVCHPGSGTLTAEFAAWRSTTGWVWMSARPGTATARAWWKRPTTQPRSAGGAPCPTAPPGPPPSRAWMR